MEVLKSNMNKLSDLLSVTLFIVIISVLLLIWNSLKKQRYWKERGVPFVKPYPIVGSILDDFLKPRNYIEKERYIKYGPIYGYFEGNTPSISVADLKLLRNIFVKDFKYFTNRRNTAVGDEIVDKKLTTLEGEDWKRVRNIISPTFSTGKLKRLLSIFKGCSKNLVQNIQMFTDKGEPINAKDLYGALSMDVIFSSIFSTKLNLHNDPQNIFVQKAREIFDAKVNWRLTIASLFPNFMKFVQKLFKVKTRRFFVELIFQIIEERVRTGQVRNDFLQLLLDTAKETAKEEKLEESDKETDILRNYGDEFSDQNVDKTAPKKNLTMHEVVAQCVTFFLAGYETVSTTLAFASYCLAMNQEIQEKLLKEIMECLKETNGEPTYDAIQKMKYMDNVISETMRLYPATGRVERKTELDYKLGDTGITIPKGMLVSIPIYALHTDPKLFPNPEKFDPDRFTAEERAKRDPYAYAPFGAGPRNCIGMRFALLELKMAMVHVLSHFHIKTCPQTQIPPEIKVNIRGLLYPKEILLRMESRENNLLSK